VCFRGNEVQQGLNIHYIDTDGLGKYYMDEGVTARILVVSRLGSLFMMTVYNKIQQFLTTVIYVAG
jgi:hypothetical protein